MVGMWVSTILAFRKLGQKDELKACLGYIALPASITSRQLSSISYAALEREERILHRALLGPLIKTGI